jgi:hypothetical protein
MGRMRNIYKILAGNLKGRDNFGDPSVDNNKMGLKKSIRI